jgi:hypothetical protein
MKYGNGLVNTWVKTSTGHRAKIVSYAFDSNMYGVVYEGRHMSDIVLLPADNIVANLKETQKMSIKLTPAEVDMLQCAADEDRDLGKILAKFNGVIELVARIDVPSEDDDEDDDE